MRRRCRRIGWSSDPSLQKTTATTGSEPERSVQTALQRGVGDAEPHHHPPPQRQQLQSQPCLRQRRQLGAGVRLLHRSEEHTSELKSLMRISYAVFCLKKNRKVNPIHVH